MVSVVTGSGNGLVNTSKDVLGGAGGMGQAATGRAGEQITVNAANGNLVIQDRDEYLVGVGPDVDLLRTYNSQGGWDGDNGDGWRVGYYRRVSGRVGTVNTTGSSIKRTDADGHEASYSFDTATGKYLTAEGSGQFDSLSYSAGVWTWTDGDTGTAETYANVDGEIYRLSQVSDAQGNLVKVDYDGGGLISSLSTFKAGSSTADEVVTLNYTGTQLSKITTSYKDAQGAQQTRSVTSYGYTGGRLSLVTTDLTPEDTTDSSTYTVSYGYDTNGRLQTLTQKDGNTQTIDYWPDSRVKSITDDQNRKTGFVYDTTNRTTTVTDALGQVTTLKYLGGVNSGQLEEISGALLGGVSFKQSYTYDNGDVLTSTNAKGEVTTYEYAGAGKLARRTDAAGNVLERTYTSTGLLATETTYTVADPDGVAGPLKASGARTTQYIYDTTQIAKRRLAYVLGPQGEVTRYVYNGWGLLARQVQYTAAVFSDPNPSFTSLESWVNGPQAQSLDRQIVEFDYDLRGLVKEQRRYTTMALSNGVATPGGAIKTFTSYDAFGRLLSSKDINNNGTTYLYDGLNRVTKSVDANAAITLYTYADSDRKTSVKLDNGLTTVQIFDTMGRLVSSDLLGAVSQTALGATKYFYDAAGQLRRVQDATSVSSHTLYDVSGRKSADIAANGQLTEYLYDGAGRLIQTVAYATLVSEATRASLSDAQGQPTAKTVADVRPAVDATNDRVTTFCYDAAGRLAGTLDADGYLTENKYDGTSALTAQTRYATVLSAAAVSAARLIASSGTTQANVPTLPTPTADAARDRTTRNLYDATGRLAARVDGDGGLTVWKYDAAGNMLSQLRRSALLSDAQRANPSLADLQALAPLSDDEFTQWVYDTAGRQIAQVNAEGYLTEYKFDTAGRPAGGISYLTQAIKPVISGSPASLKLFKTGDLTAALRTSLSSPKLPLSTSKTYNNRGLLEQETAADGTVTFYDYDSLQRLKSTTLAKGSGEERKQNISYDDWGRVQSTQIEGDATSTTSTYDAAGRRTSVTDARGNKTFFYYDAQGRQVYAILRDPIKGGEVTETIYSNFSEVQATVTRSQRLSVADATGLVGGKADTAVVSRAPAADISLSSAIAALNNAGLDNRSAVTFNQRGLIQQAIDALGNKADYSYNAFGQLSKEIRDIDPVGTANARRLTLDYGYDRRGNATRTERGGPGLASAVITGATFDALGRLYNTTDELSRITQYTYLRDGGTGRKITIAGPAGTTSTTYDALDRTVTRVDRTISTVTYTHDAVNRKLTVKTAAGIQTVTEYNRHGQVYKVTDGAGATTTYAYDAHGNLLTVTDALGNVTQNGYDANDNLIQVVQGLKANAGGAPINDGAASTTSYSFDAANRVLIQTVDPLVNGVGLNLQTRYEYDGQGRKLKITDPRGTVTTQVYNARGELADVIVDDVTGGLKLKTSYSYDAQSRVLTVIDGAGTTSARKVAYAYDILGRRTSETVDPDGLKLKTSYEYDAAGRLLLKRDSQNNVTARYSYDNADRLRYGVDALGAATRYDYDGEGRVTAIRAYATTLAAGWASKTYDELRTALDILSAGPAEQLSINSYDGDGRLIYSVDALGQVTERKYDGANRLVLERRYEQIITGGSVGMSASAIYGKLVKVDAKDHVTRYAYDKVGNQRFVVNAEGFVSERRYDAAGRIVASVEHEQPWTWSVGTVPSEADLAAIYSPTKREFNRDMDGLGGSVGIWEAGRLKLVSEPLPNGGYALMTSPKQMPVGSVLKLDYQPVHLQQTTHIMLKDGAGGMSRAALIFKNNGHVYTQCRQLPAGTFVEVDIGVYVPGKTYSIEMESTATGARVFVYEKGTSRASGLAATIVEPTTDWQSVRVEFAVSRASDLPAGQTISYVDNVEEIPPLKGRVTQFAYDAAGRQRFAIDAEGYVTETRYDDANARTTALRYASRLSGSGSYTPAAFAPVLNTLTVALPGLGAATSVIRELDRAGRLSVETDGNGVQTQFTYDAAGRLETEVLAGNVVGQASTTRYAYNGAGQRISITRADGTALASTTRFEYDAQGRLWHEIDPRGVALTEGTGAWEQAERARLGYAADLSTLAADAKAAAQTALRKLYTTDYGYDAAGRVTTVTDALGGVTATDYDAFGHASVITDARGYKRYQVYDKAGRLLQTVDAQRYLTAYGYDAFGNLTSSLRVDAKVQGTLSGGQAVVLATAAQANGAYVLTAATADALTSRTYDRNGRLLQETDAENYVEGTDVLDAYGQRLSVKNKLGATVTYTYDRLGRLLTETLPVQAKDGTGALKNVVNEYQYDSRGNRITSIEAKGLPEQRTTQMAYDANDRLVRRIGMSYTATAADGSTSTVTPADAMRYDARGNVIEQVSHGQLQADGLTVSGGRRSVAWYDALDQKTLEISADRVASRASYDAAGNQVVQTVYATRIADGVTLDPVGSAPAATADTANDRTLRTLYDALNRKTQTSLDNLYAWSSGDGTNLVISGLTPKNTVLQSFFYDAVGNLTERKDGRDNSSFEYFDGNGRRTLSIDAGGAAVAWEYGHAGNVATKQTRYAAMLPGGYARQADKLASAGATNDPAQLIPVIAGQFVPTGEQNRITEVSLDRLGRVTEQRLLNVAQDTVDASGTRTQSTTTAITRYQYNGLGAVTQTQALAAEVGTTLTWEQTDITYDALGRETRREAPGYVDYLNANVRPTTDTEYDGLGQVRRRIQRGRDTTVETDDRITLSGYDANGLLVQTTDAAGAITTYAYDANGNLARRVNKDVRRSDSTASAPKLRDIITSYEFDAAGRIVVEKHWESDKTAAAETRKTRYNAFGEFSAKGIGDGWEEFAEYSTLGKVVKTNSGDGAIKFYVYDANGNMTREIRGNGDATYKVAGLDVAIDLRSLTLQQATSGKRNPADTAFLPLYSRVSVYNARNLITQTIDPQIDVLKSAVTMQSQFNTAWVPAWQPPNALVQSATILPRAQNFTLTNGTVPKLNITQPGSRQLLFSFDINEGLSDFSPTIFSLDNSGVFSLNLESFKGKGVQYFQYAAITSTSSYPIGRTLAMGRGTFEVDGAGNIAWTDLPAKDNDRQVGSVKFSVIASNPGGWVERSYQLTDASGAFLEGSTSYSSPYLETEMVVGKYRPTGTAPSPKILYLKVNQFWNSELVSKTITIRIYNDGTISTTDVVDPTVMPIEFYVQGRNIKNANITVNGITRRVTGTYEPTQGGRSGYTWFRLDARDMVSAGCIYSYSVDMLNADGTIFRDEVGNPLRQEGKVDIDGSGAARLLQQVQLLNTGEKVTIKRFQSFNAFGDVVEERDERVAERMLAAINDDRKSKNQSALTALTTDQLASAKTTLQYNTQGQLIAKLDPETFVTAENGYRYRARPITRFGYDLLGRHTTMLQGSTTLDPNGNLSRVQYLAGSRGDDALVISEFDAAGGSADAYNATGGGIRTSQYDIFGDARKTTDAEGAVTERSYDKRGLLTTVTRKGVQRLANATSDTLATGRDLSDTYAYDELGQRLTATNALNITTRTDYDALQRVVQTVSGNGFVTGYTYELRQAGASGITSVAGAGGAATTTGGYVRTTLQTDGRSLIDKVDYFGHTTWHQDLSGAQFTYTFNSAAQLVKQTSTVHTGQSTSQNVDYTYYANGYIRSFTDNTQGITSEYAYDNAGNRVAEGTFSLVNGTKTTAYQNATITYDELNRISRVRDANFFDVAYEFDAVGNRRRITATYWDGLAGLLGGGTQDYWYAYDKLNRFVVSKGRLETGAGVATTTRGTGLADTGVVIKRGTEGTQLGYDKVSQRRLATYTYQSGNVAQTIDETYGYSQDGYLQTTKQGTTLVATRKLDDIGRTVLLTDLQNKQSTASTYDKDNRLLAQSFIGKIDNLGDTSGNFTLTYKYYTSTADTTTSDTGTGALASSVQQPTSGFSTTTTYQYKYWDSEQQSKITKAGAGQENYTTLGYDINGHISSTFDDGSGVSRSYVTNANGQVLRRSGTNGTHYFYYADGHRVGDVGNTPDDKSRVSYAEELARRGSAETADQRRERYKNPSPVTSADFDQNYEPINDNFPGNAASSYTVRRNGETLRDIAQAMWGDSSLWYLIAESNGMLTDGALVAGRVIVIPNKVTNIHNNASTWRPYNPGEAIGAVDPTLFSQSAHKKLIESMDWREAHPVEPLVHPHGRWISGNRSFVQSYDSGESSGQSANRRNADSAASVGYYDFNRSASAATPLSADAVTQALFSASYSGTGNWTSDVESGATNNWSANQMLSSSYSFSASLEPQLSSWGSGFSFGVVSVGNLDWRDVGLGGLGSAIGESLTSQSKDYSRWGSDDTETQRLLARYPAPAALRAAGAADEDDGAPVARAIPLGGGRYRMADGSIRRMSVEASEPRALVDFAADTASRRARAAADGPVLGQVLSSLRIDSTLRAATPSALTKLDGSSVTYSFDLSTKQAYWNLGEDNVLRAIPKAYKQPNLDEAARADPNNPFAHLTDKVTDFALTSAFGTASIFTGGAAFAGLARLGWLGARSAMVVSSMAGDAALQGMQIGTNSLSNGRYGIQDFSWGELALAGVLPIALGGGAAVRELATEFRSMGLPDWNIRPAQLRFGQANAFPPLFELERFSNTVDPVQARIGELLLEGHGVQRHGAQVTRMQLEGRVVEGLDPMTGTPIDGVHGGDHGYAKHATKIVSDEAYVFSERYARNSQKFLDATSGSIDGRAEIKIPLKEIYGADFRDFVFGVSRYGSKNNPLGSGATVFLDNSYMVIRYKQNSTGVWRFNTMFPEPGVL
ncbi:DUF6531 domain-containing protein [Pelomonas sp. Root1237]|uniref:DUF6531 domain-containing protein n=1 Tax=Pelomonas sp. Root1237 TaxID=1736434 RepID=UPI0006FBD327|nr:DUF6531 domain-containing protein [Pelomonas sp. Root1237]KQV89386.1 hypothetical protein ASC91_12345 [Pelomonas sp. Root1237]